MKRRFLLLSLTLIFVLVGCTDKHTSKEAAAQSGLSEDAVLSAYQQAREAYDRDTPHETLPDWHDTTVSVQAVSETQWKVTLYAFFDHWTEETQTANIGCYSRELFYEKADDTWSFTDFCSADFTTDSSETMFSFTYDEDTLLYTNFDTFSSLQLGLFLLHAETEPYITDALEALQLRFLITTTECLEELGRLPADWLAKITEQLGVYSALYSKDMTFVETDSVLKSYYPRTAAEQTVMQQLRTAFESALPEN